MKLQMKLFLHMKVHMKVQKRLQVRVHEGWDPSSSRDEGQSVEESLSQGPETLS